MLSGKTAQAIAGFGLGIILASTGNGERSFAREPDPAKVCSRTPSIRKKIEDIFGGISCDRIQIGDLEQIRKFQLFNMGPSRLRKGDFDHMNLNYLFLHGDIRRVGAGAFAGQEALEELELDIIPSQSTTFHPKAFAGLRGLRRLHVDYLQGEGIIELREALSELPQLEGLWIFGAVGFEQLPSDTFTAFPRLKALQLYAKPDAPLERFSEAMEGIGFSCQIAPYKGLWCTR
jgi:hypothetical protein